MAIINNNVQNVKFLRNQNPFESREAARTALENNKGVAADGTALLARYSTAESGATVIKTIVGYVAVVGETHHLTIIDVEGGSQDVEKLRQEINAKLGGGIGSGASETVTAQLTALSGTTADASGVTSVNGAKAYADAKISELDVTAITAGEGQFIKSVSQADGKVSATTADMPSVNEIGVQGQAIVAVKQDKGTISATTGTINAEYVNVTGNTFTSTTVQGALEEIDSEYKAAIEGLDYTGVTTGDGVVITNVTENNGVVSAASANVGGLKLTDYTKGSDSGSVVTTDSINQAFSKLEKQIDAEKDARAAAIEGLDKPDSAVAKKFVTSVSEENGVISVSRGEISSSAGTMVLTDNADGGVNFEVHYDGTTIIQDPTTKELKVASSALVQYAGDEDTIHITDVVGDTKTVSSLLTISATTPTEVNVKEQYNLVGASGNTIGATIKIYKDSSVVEIYVGTNYDSVNTTTGVVDKKQIGDVVDEHTIVAEDFQYLNYVYQKADGTYEMVKINLGNFLIEPEFKSGVTVSNGVVIGVVDNTSEPFLTVGADGFKLAGVQNAIDTAVSGAVQTLDADVSGNTTHVTVNVVEADGVITGVNVAEDNIANASDLASLSAKTITDVKSANGSVTVTPGNTADGTKEIDLATDADKIKMSGFSADNTSALSGIAESDSIATAFEKTNAVITENERVTAGALTDLNTRVDTISGDVDTIKNEYISGVSVNGNAVTVANHVAPISVAGATSAMTPTSTEAIVVDTDANGNITLGISSIDCGYYS